MMLKTSLAALAENIDGCVWPIRATDETPSEYVDLPHAGALLRLRALGLSDSDFEKLVVILRGTLAFDDSFGEMVEIASKAEADLDPVTRNLARLGVPPDFPIELCNLKSSTASFCVREDIKTLDGLLAFARSASRQVIVGGDFRDLLNALMHLDEATVARFLPLRIPGGGLYFIEGLALLVRPLSDEQRQQLVNLPTLLAADARARGDQLAAYFAVQATELRAAFAAGTPLPRLVAPLNDLEIEPTVASILRLFIDPAFAAKARARAVPSAPAPKAPVAQVATDAAGAPPAADRPGFWRRFFGLGPKRT